MRIKRAMIKSIIFLLFSAVFIKNGIMRNETPVNIKIILISGEEKEKMTKEHSKTNNIEASGLLSNIFILILPY